MIGFRKEDLELLIERSRDTRITNALIQELLGVTESQARIYKSIIENLDVLKEVFEDPDLIKANVKLAKQKQLFQDSNRVERKAFREYARVENTLIKLNEAVLDKLSCVNLEIPTFTYGAPKNKGNSAIIQLSDTHFNELVDLKNNRYDFDIASKRLQRYAHEAKVFLQAQDVETVVIAMTGDMINSDRRLDEKMNMATNRMAAAMIAVQLLEFFINDLASSFLNVKVLYVTGNESRSDEFGFTDLVVTDNYDTLIFNFLKRIYSDYDRIEFLGGNPVEMIIGLNGVNVLVMHGTTLGSDTQKSIQQVVGKFVAKGMDVHYTIFGHIHFANITDLYARSGSLVGNNTYSDLGLNLVTKASQNIHLIKSDGSVHNMRVELDNTHEYPGYPIQSTLAEYNAKSASKLHQNYTILQVTI